MVIPGQVLTIGGVEAAFVGLGLDQSAYFWLAPGNARYMMNRELVGFKLAVLQCFGISNALEDLRMGRHGAQA